jgi:hypothetical protein
MSFVVSEDIAHQTRRSRCCNTPCDAAQYVDLAGALVKGSRFFQVKPRKLVDAERQLEDVQSLGDSVSCELPERTDALPPRLALARPRDW